MTADRTIARIRTALGMRCTWAEAEELCEVSRHTIQGRARAALERAYPDEAERERVYTSDGVQFRVGPATVWLAYIEGRYAIRVRRDLPAGAAIPISIEQPPSPPPACPGR